MHASGGVSDLKWAVGVKTTPLYRCDYFQIGRWRCIVGEDESTSELRNSLHLISLPQSGSFRVESGTRSAVIDSATALLVNAGSAFRMRRHVGAASRGTYLLLAPAVLEEVCAAFSVSAGAPFSDIRGSASGRAVLLRAALVSELEDVNPDPLSVEDAAVELVEEILRGLPSVRRADATQEFRGRGRRLTDDVKEILAQRFRQALSLAELARALSVSPFHLSRTFSRETGLSISRYRNALRLRTAFECIARQPVELGRLALDLGFSSQSHFGSAFRKEFGEPPSKLGAALRGHRLLPHA